MANFTAAILALTEERDRQFLLRVATDYNLPIAELEAKYLETAEKAIKVPRKYAKKVKSVETGEGPAPDATEVAKASDPKAAKTKQCCTAQTSKKEACKFSALKGEVFCKRHLKQTLGEETPKEPKVKEPKAKKEVKKSVNQPMHTHPLSETDETCDLCESHGNALDQGETDFEVVSSAPAAGPVKVPSAAQRLAAMLEEADEESGSELEMDAEGGMGEDDYEEED
jgi:hypothetical protein